MVKKKLRKHKKKLAKKAAEKKEELFATAMRTMDRLPHMKVSSLGSRTVCW